MPNRRLVRWGAVAACLTVGGVEAASACPVIEPEPICQELVQRSVLLPIFGMVQTAIERAHVELRNGESGAAFELFRALRRTRFESSETTRGLSALLSFWRASLPDDPRLALADAWQQPDDGRAVRDAFARHPNSALVAEALAEELRNDDEIGGRRLLEGFLATRSDDRDALHALLEYEWKTGRTARAAELADRWRALSPGDPEALLHDAVTHMLVDAQPAIASRLAELARHEGAPLLLFVACASASGARGERCVNAASELIDVTKLSPELRRKWTGLLIRYDSVDAASSLVDLEEDPSLRRSFERNLARALVAAGRCDQAESLAARVAEPDDLSTRTLLWQCLPGDARRARVLAALDRGDDELAMRLVLVDDLAHDDTGLETAIRARLRSAPQSAGLWNVLSLVVPEGPDLETLQREWARAQPDNPVPRYGMLNAAEEAEDWDAATAHLERLLAMSPQGDRDELRIQLVMALAAGRRTDRLEKLVLDSDPADEASVLARARIDQLEGRPDMALAAMQSLDPVTRSWQADGFAEELERETSSDEQLVAPFRPEATEPSTGWALDAAMAAWNAGRSALARSLFEQTLAEDPGNPVAWAVAARFELEERNAELAESSLRRSLALRPDETSTRTELAELLRTRGEWWAAFDLLTEYELPSDGIGTALLELARTALATREFAVAAECLRAARELEPRAFDVRFESARLAAAEGRDRAARAELDELLPALEEPDARRCIAECDLRDLRRRARSYLSSGNPTALQAQR